ncbi:MAG: molybdopterin molybdotransferase MoeA [Candidatus Binatia bacterium]|nr:molybdopterin molybdotransferase MoeA [Candidatus Binatia bacterium]
MPTDRARALIAGIRPIRDTELIHVKNAAGRVLAAAVKARADVPHFDRAVMDGYAVRAADTFGASESQPVYLRVVGSVEMGKTVRRPIHQGEAMRISTGGMLPPGADAVVMIEYTEELGDATAEVRRGVAPWENVQRVGEDVRRGCLLFDKGWRLRSFDLGGLTGTGVTHVRVFRKPRVALISTGDEIVPPDAKPKPGQVRNINEYALVPVLEDAGAAVTDYGVIRDDAELFSRSLAKALESHDAVMLSGGSSVGTKDITLASIASLPGASVAFHGISIAPGKPTILAFAMKKPILGIPGHPMSALVIGLLYAAPLVRVLGGERPERVFQPKSRVRAILSEPIASAPGREDYVRVKLEETNGLRRAVPMPGKSASVFNLIHADGLVAVPAYAEGLEAGTEVEVLLL